MVNLFRLPVRWLWTKHLFSVNVEARTALTALAKGGGYSNHPNVKRYKGREGELVQLLMDVRGEMIRRGFNPKKPIVTYGFQPKPFTYTEEEMQEDLVTALMNLARSKVKAHLKKTNCVLL